MVKTHLFLHFVCSFLLCVSQLLLLCCTRSRQQHLELLRPDDALEVSFSELVLSQDLLQSFAYTKT